MPGHRPIAAPLSAVNVDADYVQSKNRGAAVRLHKGKTHGRTCNLEGLQRAPAYVLRDLKIVILLSILLLIPTITAASPVLDRRKFNFEIDENLGELVIDPDTLAFTASMESLSQGPTQDGVAFLERRLASIDGTSLDTSALPQPLDMGLGNNFTTSSCTSFFNKLLADQSFLGCHPISLLLQTSSSFFTTTKSFTKLTQTLDASCAAPVETCSNIMSRYATQITTSSACQADYNLRNPLVTQTHAGLLAYSPVYQTTCLRDQTTNNYCFANAVTNSSAPTSSYIYYLPLGVPLPGGAMPACNTCLHNTMADFASFASNVLQPISTTYSSAAQQVNMVCGPAFVQSQVKTTNGVGRASSVSSALALIAMALACLWLS